MLTGDEGVVFADEGPHVASGGNKCTDRAPRRPSLQGRQ